MGNRAVVTFDSYDRNNVGVYLHWNGGRDSIEAFLEATRRVMDGRTDPHYAMARFVQVVTTNFPGNCSVGLGKVGELDNDNGDNGTYVVDSKTLEIKARWNFEDRVEQDTHPRDEFASQLVEAIKAGNEKYKSFV